MFIYWIPLCVFVFFLSSAVKILQFGTRVIPLEVDVFKMTSCSQIFLFKLLQLNALITEFFHLAILVSFLLFF